MTAVRAAGGIVWRRGAGGLEVLVVHRPKYGDWAFPKGKADAGESDDDCALREVEEETGLACELGPELGSTSYSDHKGRTKVVRYWAMQALGGAFAPHAEVDEIRWLALGAAAAALTYPPDRGVLALLEEAVAGAPLHARPLREGDLDPDPLRAFEVWFQDASASGARMPEAVALATATPDGEPSARMVLLKGVDERGFVFYSSYESRKGCELAANPRAALLFYWEAVGRQVRVEGTVIRVSPEESDAYFASRPPGSRLSALASRQSEIISGREALEARVEELATELAGREPPRPGYWGGYRLEPSVYEFWQHRDDRLHDRLRYHRDRDRWVVERLSP